MEITINPYDRNSLDKAIKQLKQYRKRLTEKEAEIVKRLSSMGATVASIRFSQAIYSGDNDVNIHVDWNGNVATIYANGQSVGFIEFGTGARYGYGHPDNSQKGTGPGTWSTGPNGKGHWDDPNGWWFGNSQHTYGNPPAMAMYDALNTMAENIALIAKEVFSSD